MSYIEIYIKNSIADVLNMNKPGEAKELTMPLTILLYGLNDNTI